MGNSWYFLCARRIFLSLTRSLHGAAVCPGADSGKLLLEPLNVVTQQSVAGLLWLEISERLIIIAARCQLHDLESLGSRAQLCAVITQVLTLLRWHSQSPSFFSWAFSRYIA